MATNEELRTKEQLQYYKRHEFPRYCEGDPEEGCQNPTQFIILTRHQYDHPERVGNGVLHPERPWEYYKGACKKHFKDMLAAEKASAKWHNTEQPKDFKHKQTVKILAVWGIKQIYKVD